MWYQKQKLSGFVVFRDEGNFGTTAEIMSRESRTCHVNLPF